MFCQNHAKCINWQFLLLGLIFFIMQCDARAVNVSNTWTMPQEGLNVFYRFFRDRISWFEADAVCQFHHANLVTVDNSFQFDATRDLLRELDVNDIVWIGLMRPQSADRFMWSSNSRPLVADTGYWAESLPLMDAPLCAVIDPIRDYRWHALRCGGPETASFLCEMPVPSWADACNLKDMPNLTLQYMADTASIELIRNCQEEGLLRTMCRGKQDRERAVQDLICPRERLEAQRINDITNSHFKSLQIINSIPTDNNENNDIELLPLEVNYAPHYNEELQTEKNTVQRLIEQFNVDELMQADEPSNGETVSSFYKIPGLIPKPVKKSGKKVLDSAYKKDNSKGKLEEQTRKEAKRLPVEMDEMMMGDQPLQGEPEMPEQFLNEEVSNEILEHLPHIKKTNLHKEDSLEKMEKEAMAMKKNMQKSKEIENKKLLIMASLPSADFTEIPLTTTATIATTRQNEEQTHHESQLELETSWGHITTTAAATISHPMHPQKPHSTSLNEENQHPHAKESADSSHFIPPMLMVKSHYVPPASSKHGHIEHDHHQHHQQLTKHEDLPTHLETTTEELAETTQKRQNQTENTSTLVVTTPRVLDLQPTTLSHLDTSLSSTVSEKQVILNKQEQQAELMTTTQKDNSMKPITKELEQPGDSIRLSFEETQTTTSAKTLQSAARTAAKSVENIEITSVLADKSQETNENKNRPEKYNDEIKEFKIPQTSHTAADTTPATELRTTTEQSLKSTQKLYDLETTTHTSEKIKETAETTTSQTIIPTDQLHPAHKLTMEQKLTEIKNQENKEHLQITTGTTEKLYATQTEQVITSTTATTTTNDSQAVTQQTPLTTNTARQSLQQIEKEEKNQEKHTEGEKDKPSEEDKEETIVKTTEILKISTKKQEENGEDEEETPVKTTMADLMQTTTTSTTTTTTVKPITTISPQNVEKSTQTSFSSTSIIITTAPTTNLPTTKESAEDTTSIRTTTRPPTSTFYTTTPVVSSTTKLTPSTATTESEVSTVRMETSTQTSTQPPETTTRNFLKVTTEMPFKPNRRRSLIKPETVSYMKKILG